MAIWHRWSSDIYIMPPLEADDGLPDRSVVSQLGTGDVAFHTDVVDKFSARLTVSLPSGSVSATAFDTLRLNTGSFSEPVAFRMPLSETRLRLLGFGDGASDTFYVPVASPTINEVWVGANPGASYTEVDANVLPAADASWETAPSGYGGVGSAAIAQQPSLFARDGSGVAMVTATGAANPGVYLYRAAAVAGSDYTALVSLRSAYASNVQVFISWWTAAMTYISTSAGSTGVATSTGWLDLSETATAPATTAYARVTARMTGTPSSGEIMLADCFGFHLGTPATPAWYHPSDAVSALVLAAAPAAGIPVYANVTGNHLYRCRVTALPTYAYQSSGHRKVQGLRMTEV